MDDRTGCGSLVMTILLLIIAVNSCDVAKDVSRMADGVANTQGG